MAYALILGICAVTLIVLTIAAVLSEKVRNAVISSRTYKKAFAVHMNIFSSIHNRAVQNRKEDMFAYLRGVQGDILEIGAGTGANFEFLPEGSSVIALEPNPHMESYLRENVKKFPHINLKQVVAGFAENMEGIADESVEAVICTLTLCSVHDVEATLSEIKRVLKPGRTNTQTITDKLKKFESHYNVSRKQDEPGTWRNKFQRTFDNQWKYLSDGCSCSREIWTFLENAGFSTVSYEKFDLKELMLIAYLMRPHVAGFAVK